MEKNTLICEQMKTNTGGKWACLENLSTYRTALMGFAILIIVFYHFSGRGGTNIVDKVLRIAFSQGYVGVDIFMVVSGLGLTFSLLKNENLREYYIKRWVRIFPFFTFITLIECCIIRGESFGLALLRSTTLGYWFRFPYIDWYIPALVGLYAVFPLIFHRIVKPRRYWLALGIGIICFVAGVIIDVYILMDWKHMAFVYRIPDFLMGCMIAVAIKDGYTEKVVIRYIIISTLLGVTVFLLRIGGNHILWFTNLCLTPLYLILLCKVFKKLSSVNWGEHLVVPFAFVGLFSLELYRISSSFERLLTNEACPEYHYLFVLLYAIASIALSYLAYIIFKRINAWLLNKLLNFKITTRK